MLRNRQVRVGGIFNARVSDGRWRTCARNGWPLNPAVLALPQSFRPIPHRLNATWPMSRAIPKMSACRYGSFASNLVCPRHVGVISEVPVARFCRFRITSLATFDTTLRLRGLSSFCMDHLSHRPSRSWSTRSKSRWWRNSVAVFLLRNSRIKLRLQRWIRLNRATRATRFLNSNLIRRLSRGVEQQ